MVDITIENTTIINRTQHLRKEPSPRQEEGVQGEVQTIGPKEAEEVGQQQQGGCTQILPILQKRKIPQRMIFSQISHLID